VREQGGELLSKKKDENWEVPGSGVLGKNWLGREEVNLKITTGRREGKYKDG